MSVEGLAVGTVLRETYRIVRYVGGGGMGEVYEATHARLEGRFAVKVLKAGAAEHPAALLRLKREALVTSGLQHPGIVRVVDFNHQADGSPFLVMEFLDGSDLAQVIRDSGQLGLPRVAAVITQVASALGAAHRKGIVHRDLKPHNIFVLPFAGDQELIKVIDFGISKVQQATQHLTGESALIGTPLYMAPEQAIGNNAEVDARADQFSLAAIAYELLCGRPPFAGQNFMQLIYQIVNVDPPPLGAFNASVTQQLDAVIRRALAKDPAQRYASIEEFAEAFQRSALAADANAALPSGEKDLVPTSSPIAGRGPSSVTNQLPTKPRHRSRRVLLWASAMLTLAGTVAVASWLSRAASLVTPRTTPLAAAPSRAAVHAASAFSRVASAPIPPEQPISLHSQSAERPAPAKHQIGSQAELESPLVGAPIKPNAARGRTPPRELSLEELTR
jgi:serine/threonine-protein kinase